MGQVNSRERELEKQVALGHMQRLRDAETNRQANQTQGAYEEESSINWIRFHQIVKGAAGAVNGDVDSERVRETVSWASDTVKTLWDGVAAEKDRLKRMLVDDFKNVAKAQQNCRRAESKIDDIKSLVQQLNDMNKDFMQCADPIPRNLSIEATQKIKAERQAQARDLTRQITSHISIMEKQLQQLKDLFLKLHDCTEAALLNTIKEQEVCNKFMKEVEDSKKETEKKAATVQKSQIWSAITGVATVLALAGLVAFCALVPGMAIGYLLGAVAAEEAGIFFGGIALGIFIGVIQEQVNKWRQERAAVKKVSRDHDAVLQEVVQMSNMIESSQAGLMGMQSRIRELITTADKCEDVLFELKHQVGIIEEAASTAGSDMSRYPQQFQKSHDLIRALQQHSASLGSNIAAVAQTASEYERRLRFQEEQLSELSGQEIDWRLHDTVVKGLQNAPLLDLQRALAPMVSLLQQEINRRAALYGQNPVRCDITRFATDCQYDFSKSYTSEDVPAYSAASREFNSSFRQVGGCLSADAQKCLAFYKGLHSGTTGFPSLPTFTNVEVHRGIDHKFSSSPSGNKCNFTPKSASMSVDVALKFAAGKGTVIKYKMLKAYRIAAKSFFPEEEEVVIPMLTFFEVETFVRREDAPDELVLRELTSGERENLLRRRQGGFRGEVS